MHKKCCVRERLYGRRCGWKITGREVHGRGFLRKWRDWATRMLALSRGARRSRRRRVSDARLWSAAARRRFWLARACGERASRDMSRTMRRDVLSSVSVRRESGVEPPHSKGCRHTPPAFPFVNSVDSVRGKYESSRSSGKHTALHSPPATLSPAARHFFSRDERSWLNCVSSFAIRLSCWARC